MGSMTPISDVGLPNLAGVFVLEGFPFLGLSVCLCPGCGRCWSISPLPEVWAYLSMVGVCWP